MGKLEEIRAYIAKDLEAFDLDHQIYVPERFVFGQYKGRKDGFRLSQGGLFYRDSSVILAQYQDNINEKRIEIVKTLSLPESFLELIAQQGKAYVDATNKITESAQFVKQYLI